MEETVMYCADLFGTAIFAVTGAAQGISKKLDLLGIIVLSCTVGVGGGIFRDCAIGATPAAALTNETYLVLCIITGLLVFKLPRPFIDSNAKLIVYLDAVGLGVFTALGVAKGLQFHLPPVTVVLAGVITAVGGGVIRDVLVGTIPAVLKNDFYATASLIGGIFYLLLNGMNLPVFSIFVMVSLTVTAIRLLAYRYKIQLPKADVSAP